MRNRRLIDTNLIVRYLVQDHNHVRIAGGLFDACDRGELTIVLSFYERPRADIASALARLISSPGIEISEATIHVDAMNRYRKSCAQFVDCLIAATAVLKTRQWHLRSRFRKIRRGCGRD